MAEARNHHYVPQAYLRNFADGIGRKARLFTADLVDGRSFTTLVRNVAALRDFNRIVSDEHDPNAVEEAYARFEDEAAGALRRVLATESLAHKGDLRIILNLMALLVVRHPRIRNKIRDLMADVGQAMLEASTATKDRWRHATAEVKGVPLDQVEISDSDYQAMRSFVLEKRYDLKLHQNVHVSLEIETHDPVLKMLLARKWTLHIADNGNDLITSDNPSFLLPLKPQSGPFGLGYGSPDGAAIFPLSPRLLMTGVFDGPEGSVRLSKNAVAQMNTEIARHAERQAFAHDTAFEYAVGGQLHQGPALASDERFRKKASKLFT
jgi:hypothetical protein